MYNPSQNELDAEQEMHRRRNPAHRWHGIPPVYTALFNFYLRWVLARIPLPSSELPFPPPLGKTEYNPLYEKTIKRFGKYPVELYEVKRFLEGLFGEQLEAAIGRKADVDDYQYVADVLMGETEMLNPMPATVTRAFEWLNRQMEHCKKSASIPQETDTDSLAVLDAADICADDSASASFVTADVPTAVYWDALLRNYSLAKLNDLLFFVGLLDAIEPLAVAAGVKSAQWVALVTALEYKKKIATRNRPNLYRAFKATYGSVGSLSSFQRIYNEGNHDARTCYDLAMSRIE